MKNEGILSLQIAKKGKKLIIATVNWERENALRLAELGIFPGEEVQVIGTSGKMLVICALDAKIALRREDAAKIFVQEAKK